MQPYQPADKLRRWASGDTDPLAKGSFGSRLLIPHPNARDTLI